MKKHNFIKCKRNSGTNFSMTTASIKNDILIDAYRYVMVHTEVSLHRHNAIRDISRLIELIGQNFYEILKID